MAVGAVGLAEVVDQVVVDAGCGELGGATCDGLESDLVFSPGLVLADEGGVAVAAGAERIEVVSLGGGPGVVLDVYRLGPVADAGLDGGAEHVDEELGALGVAGVCGPMRDQASAW